MIVGRGGLIHPRLQAGRRIQQLGRLWNGGTHQLGQIDRDLTAVMAAQQLAGQADVVQFLCHGDHIGMGDAGWALYPM